MSEHIQIIVAAFRLSDERFKHSSICIEPNHLWNARFDRTRSIKEKKKDHALVCGLCCKRAIEDYAYRK